MGLLGDIIDILFPFVGKDLFEPLMNDVCQNPIQTFFPNAFIALVASFLFSLFVYFIKYFIFEEKRGSFFVGELQELILTVVLFFITSFLFILPCSPYYDSVSGLSLNSYERTYYFLQSVKYVLEVIIIYGQLPYFFLSLLNFEVEVFGVPTTAPLGAYSILQPTFQQAITFSSISYALFSMFVYMFDILTYGFVVYLLPIGLFFRSFYLTRKIGGSIIALVITFGVVVPLFTSFFYAFENMVRPSYINVDINSMSFSFLRSELERSLDYSSYPAFRGLADLGEIDRAIEENVNNSGSISFFRRLGSYISGISSGPTGAFLTAFLYKLSSHSTIGPFVKKVLYIPFLLIAFFGMLNFVIVSYIYGFFFMFFFTIVFGLVVITAGRYLSSVIGEELDMGNLTRLI